MIVLIARFGGVLDTSRVRSALAKVDATRHELAKDIEGHILPRTSHAEHRMGMPALHRRWTAAEVRELMSDPNPTPRYELLDGDLLVTPSPRPVHQRVVQQLLLLLAPYVERIGIGEVLLSPADLELEPETILQPDLFVVPRGHIPDDSWAMVKALLVAVEVLSPSSAHVDRVRKRRFFQRVGVPEYWVVDIDARLIER